MRKIASLPFVLLFLSLMVRADLPIRWEEKVYELNLANGMKFLLYRRGEAPIFSAYIRFRAGGIDEEEGKTGLAHFLEHMAFKGTEKIGTTDYRKEKPILEEIEKIGKELAAEYGKGRDAEKIRTLRERLRSLHRQQEKYLTSEELSKKILENGGVDLNATTSKDITSYFVSLPSEKFRFWAEIESERIFRPVFREFYEEKDVVLEERRMRVDNDPDGRLYEAFLATAFQKSPYRWPTIGREEDILTFTGEDLQSFWRRHYRPPNAVGCVVGNFDRREAEKILQETFGRISAGEGERTPPRYEDEPPQEEERRVALRLPARPRLWIGYHKPTLPEVDDYLFDLINQILGEGRSSRLYKRLVLEERVASNVETNTSIPGARLPNLFLVEVDLLGDHSPEEALRLFDREIEEIKNEGVTTKEVERARNRLSVNLIWHMKTNEGLASELSYYETVGGGWRYLATYLEKISRFRPEDVQRVARAYLNRSNRTVAVIRP